MNEYLYKNGDPVWVGPDQKQLGVICCNHGIITSDGVKWIVELVGGDGKFTVPAQDLCDTLKERQ